MQRSEAQISLVRSLQGLEANLFNGKIKIQKSIDWLSNEWEDFDCGAILDGFAPMEKKFLEKIFGSLVWSCSAVRPHSASEKFSKDELELLRLQLKTSYLTFFCSETSAEGV